MDGPLFARPNFYAQMYYYFKNVFQLPNQWHTTSQKQNCFCISILSFSPFTDVCIYQVQTSVKPEKDRILRQKPS